MKKCIALLLALCLLFGAMAGSVSAAKKELTKEEALRKSASRSYYKSLSAAGKTSFHGYCGLMTSCQLRALDINSWRITNDGNKQFDYYSNLEVTSGGYYITPYFLEDYSMEEALNHLTRNGTQDVYNILVGFQWTNTAAGSRYGHAVFINGILDGTVYFVESYDCSLNRYWPEGSVITCSIAEFVAYYEPWTTYEGLIWFGNGSYADSCQKVGTDLMIQTRFATTLRSQPAVVGQNGCEILRPIAAGERLWAVAILDDAYGDRYYQVTDGEVTGYVSGAAAYVIRVNPEDLSAQDLQITQHVASGAPLDIRGQVLATNGNVSAMEITLTDNLGQPVVEGSCDAGMFSYELQELCNDLPIVPDGTYLVEIYGVCDLPMPVGQELRSVQKRILLGRQTVQVGGNGYSGKAYPSVQKYVEQEQEGWFFQNECWYCYENGQPVSGWTECLGVRYYLDEDGAALTGWQTVDGQLYKFSDTGALLCSMEAELDGAVYVLDAQGIATKKES